MISVLIKSLLLKQIAIRILKWAIKATPYKSDDALLALVLAYADQKNLTENVNLFIDAIQEDVTKEVTK